MATFGGVSMIMGLSNPVHLSSFEKNYTIVSSNEPGTGVLDQHSLSETWNYLYKNMYRMNHTDYHAVDVMSVMETYATKID
jgi:hypothetical protein